MRTIAVLALFCAGVVLHAAAGRQAREARPGVALPGVRLPMTSITPDAVFDIPGAPDWMAVDEHLWISNSPRNNVTRIDPATNKIVDNIAVGARPCSGLAAGFGSVWVPTCGDKSVSRIDLKSGKVTATFPLTIGNSEGGIAVGAGSFWIMIDAQGTLARIDPATNTVIGRIPVAPGSFAVAFGGDAVWITSTEQSLLTRVDPRTNTVTDRIQVGPKPRFLTVGDDAVWTLNQGDGSISRVDMSTRKLVATIEAGLPGGGGEIAAGEGSVWVTMLQIPLTRIDPATNTVVQQFFGEGGDSVRVGHGSVWLTDLRGGKLMRFNPAKIRAARAILTPAAEPPTVSAETRGSPERSSRREPSRERRPSRR
jgi:YVTN family beta-propeller protein